MGLLSIVQGMIVGILVTAPLGPIGVLCIQRTLNKGRVAGYASGLGAALADTFYAIVAGFGITIISNFLIDQQVYIRFFGGLLLVILGVKMFFADIVKQIRSQKERKPSVIGDFVSVFLLTASNPVTIIAFGVFFAGLGFVVEESSVTKIFLLVLGVLLGCLLWWFSLVSLINAFRNKFRLKRLFWINKIFGITTTLFGAFVMLSLLMD